MSADIVVTPRLTIPAGELSMSFARSGGPGGQNVNKVSSKVELRWNPRTSSALADDDRALLLERLASKLTNDGTLIVTVSSGTISASCSTIATSMAVSSG